MSFPWPDRDPGVCRSFETARAPVPAQLDIDDFNDGATDVGCGDQDSLARRVGARLARS
jgi:hypothetical protein